MTTPAEQIEAALQKLVEHGGNVTKASAELGMSPSTLKKWKKDHAEKYRRMELTYNEGIEDATRQRAQENAQQAGDLLADLLSKVKDNLDRMDGREAAQAARAVADAHAKSIDKWMTLTGRNPEGNRRGDDLWAELMAAERAGVIKFAPAVKSVQDVGSGGATDSDGTAAAAPDTPGAESEDARSNV